MKPVAAVPVLLAVLACFVRAPQCGNDLEWYLYSDNCYYVKDSEVLSESWQDANDFCMLHGGYLVSINSQNEQLLVHSFLTSRDIWASWIGLRELDFGEGPDYRWIDDSSIPVYTNWSPNEPNDAHQEEQCVEMREYNAMWNDNNCGDKLSFVCKKPYGQVGPITKQPTQPPRGHCNAGYLEHNNICYSFNGDDESSVVDWYSARDRCRATGGDLATIHSQEQQAYITSNLRDIQYAMWIGFNDVSWEGQFRWTDGSEVNYYRWAQGEPNGDREENCAELHFRGYGGLWNDAPCDSTAGYICQSKKDPNGFPQPVQNTCNMPNYSPHWKGCYRLIAGFYNRDQAEDLCAVDGAQLVSIEDVYEQAYVEYHMLLSGYPVWTGLSDTERKGSYKWSDGTPVLYTNWGEEEPSTGFGEGCVKMRTDGTWDDTSCFSTGSAMCKYWTGVQPTTPPPGQGHCPVNASWTQYGGQCYHYSNSQERKSWPEAMYECERLGGHIVTIGSEAENTYIQGVLKENNLNVWIGLHRNKQGGFEWVDDKPVSFTAWGLGEPNGLLSGENCAEMYFSSGDWNDVECYREIGFVCKTNLISGQSPSSGGLSAGAIVGIVFAVLIVLSLVIVGSLKYTDNLPDITFPELPSLFNKSKLNENSGFDSPAYASQTPNITVPDDIKLDMQASHA
ncbi:macrophage mannose receptor 1-like [Glandiceps talaboti]